MLDLEFALSRLLNPLKRIKARSIEVHPIIVFILYFLEGCFEDTKKGAASPGDCTFAHEIN